VRQGIVFLTGGGFQRIDNAYNRVGGRLVPLVQDLNKINVTIAREAGKYDTKHLTIAGLARMASLGGPNIRLGEDVSGNDPRHHGEEILQRQNIERTPSVLSWWGLLGAELNSIYPAGPRQ
jgi:hypothetical protein